MKQMKQSVSNVTSVKIKSAIGPCLFFSYLLMIFVVLHPTHETILSPSRSSEKTISLTLKDFTKSDEMLGMLLDSTSFNQSTELDRYQPPLFQYSSYCQNTDFYRTEPSSKNDRVVLVTMADEVYAAGAIAVVYTALKYAEWQWDIVVLHSENIRDCVKESLHDMGVKLRPWKNRLRYKGASMKPHFNKMDVFLDPFYRKYDRLVFLDSDHYILSNCFRALVFDDRLREDVINRDPLHPTFAVVSVHPLTTYRDITFKLQTKASIDNFQTVFPDRSPGINTRFFVINPKEFPKPFLMASQVNHIINEYRPFFKHEDQSLMALLFYNQTMTFPQRMIQSSLRHWYGAYLPWKGPKAIRNHFWALIKETGISRECFRD